MNIIALFLIGLLAVPAILITKFVINMQRRLINAEESKQRLKEEFEAKLRVEERKHRDFGEKIFKIEKERSRLESALRRLVAYQEAFEKDQKTKQNLQRGPVMRYLEALLLKWT
jgi:hypothetical protein